MEVQTHPERWPAGRPCRRRLEWRREGWGPSQLITHRTRSIRGIMNVSPNDFLSLI